MDKLKEWNLEEARETVQQFSESTGGVTESLKGRVTLPLTGSYAELNHVLVHELVHAFQFDITGEGGGIAMAGVPAIMRYPLQTIW